MQIASEKEIQMRSKGFNEVVRRIDTRSFPNKERAGVAVA